MFFAQLLLRTRKAASGQGHLKRGQLLRNSLNLENAIMLGLHRRQTNIHSLKQVYSVLGFTAHQCKRNCLT